MPYNIPGLTTKQISELDAAALKPNKSATDIANLDYATKTFGYQSPTEEGLTPEEAEEKQIKETYDAAIPSSPAIQDLLNGGSSLEDITYALETGNWSGIKDWDGKPFSSDQQQEALSKANEDNRLYYEALQQKETADAESKMAQDQADYQNYLVNAGQSFESDKIKSDQQAANKGVLFSGARVQKEKNLAKAYSQDEAYNKSKYAGSIGKTASDFQYDYGNKAAEGLNKYYNLGGNTYNPKVARGGVNSTNLSSIYSPSKYNFQGARNTERSSESNVRAARYLTNKGNKLIQTGYENKL